jgi:hypothetical protein
MSTNRAEQSSTSDHERVERSHESRANLQLPDTREHPLTRRAPNKAFAHYRW